MRKINNDREITVKKSELLKVLKEGREKHLKEYEAACDGYLVDIQDKAKEARKIISDGLKKLNHDNPKEQPFFNAFLQIGKLSEYKPTCHVEEFDQIIGMLEASVDSEVEITGAEYNCYYLHKWDWADAWAAQNSTFIAKTRIID